MVLSTVLLVILAVVTIAIIAPSLLVFGGVFAVALPIVDVIVFVIIVRAIIKHFKKKN